MAAVGLIIKGTRLCNLRCTYCHDWRAERDQVMPFGVQARLIAAALTDTTHDAVDFIWHGGETTLLPIAFYKKALLVQSRFRRPGQLVQNTIQTNGTRLTPEWLRFLRDNDFGVGVSVDGPPELHDRYRRDVAGRASSPDVANGMRMLREFGIPFTVLMVVDEGALALGADRIFDYFLEEDIRSFGLISAKPTNRPEAPPGTPTDHYSDPGKMTTFLIRMYERWREHGDPDIHIRELVGLRSRVALQPADMCTLAGACLGKYFLIEPNGDIAHCDLFLGDSRYTLGNILTHSFADLRRGTPLRQLELDRASALDQMRACPDFGVCQGWCPHERYMSQRHNPNHRDECCGLHPLIDHIRTRETAPEVRPAYA